MYKTNDADDLNKGIILSFSIYLFVYGCDVESAKSL